MLLFLVNNYLKILLVISKFISNYPFHYMKISIPLSLIIWFTIRIQYKCLKSYLIAFIYYFSFFPTFLFIFIFTFTSQFLNFPRLFLNILWVMFYFTLMLFYPFLLFFIFLVSFDIYIEFTLRCYNNNNNNFCTLHYTLIKINN